MELLWLVQNAPPPLPPADNGWAGNRGEPRGNGSEERPALAYGEDIWQARGRLSESVATSLAVGEGMVKCSEAMWDPSKRRRV
jgi:hypothetical protein